MQLRLNMPPGWTMEELYTNLALPEERRFLAFGCTKNSSTTVMRKIFPDKQEYSTLKNNKNLKYKDYLDEYNRQQGTGEVISTVSTPATELIEHFKTFVDSNVLAAGRYVLNKANKQELEGLLVQLNARMQE